MGNGMGTVWKMGLHCRNLLHGMKRGRGEGNGSRDGKRLQGGDGVQKKKRVGNGSGSRSGSGQQVWALREVLG